MQAGTPGQLTGTLSRSLGNIYSRMGNPTVVSTFPCADDFWVISRSSPGCLRTAYGRPRRGRGGCGGLKRACSPIHGHRCNRSCRRQHRILVREPPCCSLDYIQWLITNGPDPTCTAEYVRAISILTLELTSNFLKTYNQFKGP